MINAQRLAKSATDLACAYITLRIGAEVIQISKRSSSRSRPPQLDRYSYSCIPAESCFRKTSRNARGTTEGGSNEASGRRYKKAAFDLTILYPHLWLTIEEIFSREPSPHPHNFPLTQSLSSQLTTSENTFSIPSSIIVNLSLIHI